MSKLKNQLQVILPKLSAEANHNRDPEVKFRYYALKALVESKKNVKKACEARGISADFFYEWGGRLLRKQTLLSLKSHSRKPKHCPHQTPKKVERQIRKLRVAEPSHGFDDREFYASAKGFKNYSALERNTRGWNGQRHTAKLGWRTPNEVIANAQSFT